MSEDDDESELSEDDLPAVDDDDAGESFDHSLSADAAMDDDALSQCEIDDLFGISMDEGEPTSGLQVLLNSNQIQHKRMPLLEACFDRLVRSLNKSLRTFTTDNVELSLVDTNSVRFGNYIETVPLPTLISVFKANEWNDYGLINIDSPLIYSILDVLLGGRQSSMPLAVEGRSFTAIEVTLIERMVNLILKDMTTAFKPLADVEFCHERMESNPSLATIAYPTDTAILFKIDVDMDSRGGTIEVLIPYPTLEPVRHLLQQMFMGEKFGRDSIWENHWAREMLFTDVELEVSLGEQIVSLSEITTWKVGSTLKLRKKPNELVTLRCGDTHLLEGKVGRVGDSVAIKVEDWISDAKRQFLKGHL
jgi:flagellar motor switch protein FliM